MTNELEEMGRMIKTQREIFERNMDYLAVKILEMKSLGTAIGEVSQYDCLKAVKEEFNNVIDRMISIY
jgi:hypothetical protein